MIFDLQGFCFLLGLGSRNRQKIFFWYWFPPLSDKILEMCKNKSPWKPGSINSRRISIKLSAVQRYGVTTDAENFHWVPPAVWNQDFYLLKGKPYFLYVFDFQNHMTCTWEQIKMLPTFKWNFISTTLLCCRWPFSRTDVHHTSGSEVPRHLFLHGINNPKSSSYLFKL